MLGGWSHLSSPAPPAFASAPPSAGEAFEPVSLKVPTCVRRLQVLCELAGQGSGGSRSPWRDEAVVRLRCGAACGEGGGAGWRRLCRHSGPRSTGKPGLGFKAAPGYSSQAELSSALLSASGALLRGRVGRERPGACPAPEKPLGRGMAVPGPATLRAGCLAPGCPRVPPPPASPASPIPHLAVLLQAPQPLVGLGASVRLVLLGHLRGRLLDACHGHPAELLPPGGAALLGVGTLGPWPHKSLHGCRADPLSQWPLGTMPPLVTKAWRSPWRRPRPV